MDIKEPSLSMNPDYQVLSNQMYAGLKLREFSTFQNCAL